MKSRLALALVAFALAVPPGAAYHPPDGSTGVVSTRDPEGLQETPTYRCPAPDALNVVDLSCSQNDVCAGAEDWRGRTVDLSTGNVGGSGDPEDWSRIELYRTETFTPTVSAGSTVEHGGLTCSPSLGSPLYVEQNGIYYLRVRAEAHGAYKLEYQITADDAISGKDAPNTAGEAWFINAFPESTDPSQNIFVYKGSLPNRGDQPLGPDQDWYRIGSSLALLQDPDTQGPTIGLLTIEFSPDCNRGTYAFGLYEKDGLTQVGTDQEGCGFMSKSCITTGLTPVHAKMSVTDGTGTGYNFTADLVPLYLVDLSNGVPRPRLLPEEPWCDPLVQDVLENVPGWEPGTELGVVNEKGLVVASARTR